MGNPKPTDFDKFLPWACKQYRVGSHVVIVRAARKVFKSCANVELSNKLKKSSLKVEPLKESSSEPSVSGSDEMHSSTLDKAVVTNGNKVMIETVYNDDNDLIQVKFLKNKFIPRKIMQIIALTLPYQKYLKSMNINSGLHMDSLYEISKFLPNSQITELCFDGTFINRANYHILLTHAKLKHLSLARCTINDDVVKMVADQLKDPGPAAKILTALNLSSNEITDFGAKYLAEVLRTNRQLSYLNLAGNMITDEGGMSILDTLQKFMLQPEELLESRAKYVGYLKKRNALTYALHKEHQTVAFNKTPQKKWLKKTRHINNYLRSAVEQELDDQVSQEKAENLAEGRMGLFDDAFSRDNTETLDGVGYCFGNNTLCCLNLAYNNLTYASLKKLLEVLMAQQYYNRSPRGLIRVVIEGNLMPEDCEEFEKIEHLLGSVMSSRTKLKPVIKKTSTIKMSLRSSRSVK